uniref:Slc35a-4 n=1 Tax=Schmidtea mediterranea TaxID=79327 RepID=A0A0H3YF96_SCHMD|nr:slc35a-4 [Schmidtea mediterranea]
MDEDIVMKWFSLIFLTVQNVSLVLMMRYVRTRPGDLFFTSTAVVWSEFFKFFMSLLILLYTFKMNIKKFLTHLRENVINDPWDWLLISVPAILYVLQNNLLFVAISNLDAATFQVCYQLKLLTTALFFRLMLGKPQSKVQWFSLVLLFVGIGLVQLQGTKPSSNSNASQQNPTVGIIVVIVASLMSGFSGVYFEKLLKNTPKNVWIRNVQLSTYGVVFGLLTVFSTDKTRVISKGFFFGYDYLVWIVIIIQSVGGLLVAVVIKYADNIFKGFATTVAIVLAALISMFLFSFEPGFYFSIGASMVIIATICYSKYPYDATSKTPQEPINTV